MTTTHEVKIWSCYANNIVNGKKKFEVRYNDRDYQVGDDLLFKVIDVKHHKLNNARYKIIYIHTGLGMIQASSEGEDDYVVLGIEPYERKE